MRPSSENARFPVGEVLAACLILAWRFRTLPAGGLPRDWTTLLCLAWIAMALVGRTKAGPVLLGLLMALLFLLYAADQVPRSLAILGALR